MVNALCNSRIRMAGHRSMVGRAVVRHLGKKDAEMITAGGKVVDLALRSEVAAWKADGRHDGISQPHAEIDPSAWAP